MTTKEKLVNEIPLFRGLPAEQISCLASIAVEKSYFKGETIFTEGEEGRGFFVVISGTVKIFKVSQEGKEQILHIFGSGEPFGEVAVFCGRRLPANAQALTTCRFLYFPRQQFVTLITANPHIALGMLAILSLRLHNFADQIESLSLKEIPSRLAAYLLSLSEEQGTDNQVLLGISKGELASLLGTIPETLSRIFTRLSGKSIIEVNGATIRLLNKKRLAEMAE
jgi:CRP/FNR family transcriptional regulator, dissimilatory nitrate respiration regulator